VSATFGNVDPATARRMMEESGLTLVDVRTHEDWEAGHAPGAVHARLRDLDSADYQAKGAVLVVCRSDGGRSAKAATALAEAGLTVHNVVGGMLAWAEAGQPVVRSDDAPGTVV
jgi:rhodanese-related sulfurtransferase